MMTDTQLLYLIALTRLTGLNFALAHHVYTTLGSAEAVYQARGDMREAVPDLSPRAVEALRHWDDALMRAECEVDFIRRHGIVPLALGGEGYPKRLAECDDAPLLLYFKGNGQLDCRRVISVVGTRHCTPYGRDLIRNLIADLHSLLPEVLIVSGLAYGVDICAHREALAKGMPTVGVLAHGLDEIYPPLHRDTAKEMLSCGGLLTEYMSQTRADKVNFVKRNRIVAGMADVTVLVESAAKGGGLITTRLATDYCRDVMAFPGPVGAPWSEGCNQLIRRNGAHLITSAADLVDLMQWSGDVRVDKARKAGIERSFFPNLSPDESRVVEALTAGGDMTVNHLAVATNLPAGTLMALLFQLEMSGVVKPLAGATYHLLKP